MRVHRSWLIGLYFAITHAQADPLPEWKFVPGLKSANIAATQGAQLVSSAGHGWPDGRQAVVTFWRLGALYLRSRSFFDAAMVETGDICEQPEKRGN
jgi:hypothetical protein